MLNSYLYVLGASAVFNTTLCLEVKNSSMIKFISHNVV